jgi:hypothetical protein
MPKLKAKPKINKKQILSRLVEVPESGKRIFYAREMKLLNDLCERYSLEFINVVNFGKKFDSLAYLTSPKLKRALDQKFRAFNYVVDPNRYPTYHIGERHGKDSEVLPKKKTIKKFLNE